MSFFSEMADEVAVLEESFVDVDEFLLHLEGLEAEVVRAALLVAGDREFPDALRDEVMSVVALARVTKVPFATRGWQQARLTRTSPLVDGLAALFARIETQGVLTRFGRITADLPAVLEARDTYDVRFAATILQERGLRVDQQALDALLVEAAEGHGLRLEDDDENG